MTKLSLSRIFETSKILASKAGQEMAEMITYLADFAEQTIRALTNGLTFIDNFNCTISTYTLTHGVDQAIAVAKTPTGVIPVRALTTTNHITSFGWYLNEESDLVVNAQFVSGSSTTQVDVTLVILF